MLGGILQQKTPSAARVDDPSSLALANPWVDGRVRMYVERRRAGEDDKERELSEWVSGV